MLFVQQPCFCRVETTLDTFIPVLVYNNRSSGMDGELLDRFDEPAWNFQVIRFLDRDGNTSCLAVIRSGPLLRQLGEWPQRAITSHHPVDEPQERIADKQPRVGVQPIMMDQPTPAMFSGGEQNYQRPDI